MSNFENTRHPIWVAYLFAPGFILSLVFPVAQDWQMFFVLAPFAIGSGLVCAMALHAYIFVKRMLVG